MWVPVTQSGLWLDNILSVGSFPFLVSFHNSPTFNSQIHCLKRLDPGCAVPCKETWSMTPVDTIRLHWYPIIPKWSLKRDSLMIPKTEAVAFAQWVGRPSRSRSPFFEVRYHIWGNIPSDPRVGHTDWY